MDAKVLYWTGALVNLGVIMGLVVQGVRLARRGEIARHRRSMTIAGALVVGFLGSYVVKLAVLGREDLSLWSATHLGILRFHETCVLVMLVGGAVAGVRAFAIRGTRRVTRRPEDPATPEATLRGHRRAGWAATIAALFGFVSAIGILLGMVERSG